MERVVYRVYANGLILNSLPQWRYYYRLCGISKQQEVSITEILNKAGIGWIDDELAGSFDDAAAADAYAREYFRTHFTEAAEWFSLHYTRDIGVVSVAKQTIDPDEDEILDEEILELYETRIIPSIT